MRFPGQYFDEETNLHYNHFRYYDPEVGRYITSDPIGLMGGLNIFLYALNDPMGRIDRSGLIVDGIKKALVEAGTAFAEAISGEDALNKVNANKEVQKSLRKTEETVRDLNKIDPDLAKRKNRLDKLLQKIKKGGKVVVKGVKSFSPPGLAETFARETLLQDCAAGNQGSCLMLNDFFDAPLACPAI